MCAAAEEDHTRMVQLLLFHLVNVVVSKSTRKRARALHIAAVKGNEEKVKLLLNHHLTDVMKELRVVIALYIL